MSQEKPLDPLDDHPENDMRLENDIMKLKLQAEFGAKFGETGSDMPPELEHQFLQHVYDFEKAWEKQEAVTIESLLGSPEFTPYQQLPKGLQQQAWQQVLDIYAAKNISVDFTSEYPLEVQYRFATEELPLHKTMFVDMPGMMLGFIYEEFHPNHAVDMETRVGEFLEGWFQFDPDKCLRSLSDEFIADGKEVASKDEVAHKLSQVFDSFDQFEDTGYFISSTSYDLQETGVEGQPPIGMGYVEGGIGWKARMENGELVNFTGAFKFYLEFKYEWWSVMHFQLPGWQA